MSPNGAGARRAWFVAACLVVLFVAALFLRAYWNLDAANPEPGEFILSGGSDPYYHKRAVDAIQANGYKHYLGDPLLNYPVGSENPNPPLYQWSIAVTGALLAPLFDPVTTADGASLSALEVSTWYATIWSPAIFGALTVFTVYAIAAALFDRRAGLVAALLWTVSTSAVDAGGVGLADHDAAVVFFVTLAMLFYIQAIRHFRGEGNWVTRWSDTGALGAGIGKLVRARGVGFGYAVLSGIGIAAVALTWKGFNYVLGILFLYAIVQMVVDHWRNRDSTGLFLATLVAMLTGVVLALPYYLTAAVGNFLQPTWYLLAAFVVAGVVLVPTRDLPTILVLPIAAVVALVLGVFAFFVFPDVAQSLLYATVYFKQTRLYQTIAEAHPADFSTMAFGVGPLAFFLALAGWVALLFRLHATRVAAWTRIALGLAVLGLVGILAWAVGLIGVPAADGLALILVGLGAVAGLALILGGEHPEARTWIFAILWGAVAVFMAQSAVRFLINAIPVFCVFAGFMAVWVLDWLDFGAVRKSLAANRGNAWQGLRRGVRPLHIIAVVLIALLFVFPTTILAADAALPPEAENDLASNTESEFVQRFFATRMGAYGQGFGGVKPWIPAFEFLDRYDANITTPADRPAFISWWDYGHWAIAISKHPAVADNFQNGYEMAANFIVSQDEAHSIQLLASRLAEAPGSDLEAAARAANSSDPAGDAAKIARWEKADLTVEQSAALLAEVERQTGKSIRYFATDIRMLPFDNPQTPNIESGSIFYAPVTLKGDDPDDYVTTQVSVDTAGYVTLDEYKELARDPIRQRQVLGERYAFQDGFFQSAFYRHYVGTPVDTSDPEPLTGTELQNALVRPSPAYGLEHFRAIYIGGIDRIYRGGDRADPNSYLYYPGIVITEYYPGAIVEGTVTEEGDPLAGVTVTAYDDTGRLFKEAFQGAIVDESDFHVPHQSVTTDASGRFRLVAPFALEGGNVTIVASRGDARLAAVALAITREDANARRVFPGVEIQVERGAVEGVAFRDLDANGVYDPANESAIANVTVTIAGQTVASDGEGRYRVESVPAGAQNVTTLETDLQVVPASSRVSVSPGTVTTRNIGFEPKAARVNGTLLRETDEGRQAVPFGSLTFTADPNVENNTARTVSNIFSASDGNFTVSLQPGTYVVTSTFTPQGSPDRYTLEETLIVTAGEFVDDRQLVMTRQTS